MKESDRKFEKLLKEADFSYHKEEMDASAFRMKSYRIFSCPMIFTGKWTGL